jgi:hypothetical protein
MHACQSYKSLSPQPSFGMQNTNDILMQLSVNNNKYSVHRFLDKVIQNTISVNPEVEMFHLQVLMLPVNINVSSLQI